MKGKIWGLLLAGLIVLTGCESVGPKTKTGAVAGTLIGATAGGIIGHQSGRGLEGAGIGAVIGGLSGALIGSEMDKRALQTNPNHIPITQIVEMTEKALPDDAIIAEIERTKSVYKLTSEIISYLKENKVSDKVIDYMLSTTR